MTFFFFFFCFANDTKTTNYKLQTANCKLCVVTAGTGDTDRSGMGFETTGESFAGGDQSGLISEVSRLGYTDDDFDDESVSMMTGGESLALSESMM